MKKLLSLLLVFALLFSITACGQANSNNNVTNAEVNLEILNGQKKDISSKIFNKQLSKVSVVLMPLNFILFGYLTIINLNFDKMPLLNCLTFLFDRYLKREIVLISNLIRLNYLVFLPV